VSPSVDLIDLLAVVDPDLVRLSLLLMLFLEEVNGRAMSWEGRLLRVVGLGLAVSRELNRRPGPDLAAEAAQGVRD
jgi:hypothetical protein